MSPPGELRHSCGCSLGWGLSDRHRIVLVPRGLLRNLRKVSLVLRLVLRTGRLPVSRLELPRLRFGRHPLRRLGHRGLRVNGDRNSLGLLRRRCQRRSSWRYRTLPFCRFHRGLVGLCHRRGRNRCGRWYRHPCWGRRRRRNRRRKATRLLLNGCRQSAPEEPDTCRRDCDGRDCNRSDPSPRDRLPAVHPLHVQTPGSPAPV